MADRQRDDIGQRGGGHALRVAGFSLLAGFVAASLALVVTPITAATPTISERARALAVVLETEITAAVALAGTLGGRLRDGAADWKSFEADVAGAPQRRDAQALVMWAPRVRGGERARFEADSGRDSFRSLRLVDGFAEGAAPPIAAAPRSQHAPVTFAAPLARGSDWLGVDLAGTIALEAAIATARTSPQVVGPVTLPGACARRALGCTPHVFVVVPVVGRRAQAAEGHLVVALSWPAIVAAARPAPRPHGEAALGLGFPRPAAARASFRVENESWTLDLITPAHGPLSARLAPATHQ